VFFHEFFHAQKWKAFHFVNSFGQQNVFINLLTDIYQPLDDNHLNDLDTPE